MAVAICKDNLKQAAAVIEWKNSNFIKMIVRGELRSLEEEVVKLKPRLPEAIKKIKENDDLFNRWDSPWLA